MPAHRCAEIADRGRRITTAAVSYIRQTSYDGSADGSWENGPGLPGHVVDAGSRLLNMRQRYFDPAVGKFLNFDPVNPEASSGAGFNRFSYAADNP